MDRDDAHDSLKEQALTIERMSTQKPPMCI